MNKSVTKRSALQGHKNLLLEVKKVVVRRMQLIVGGGVCHEGSTHGVMEIFLVLVKPLIHGARALVLRATGEGGSVVGNGEEGRHPQSDSKQSKHGGIISRIDERVTGEKLSKVVDEDVIVTISEAKGGAR